jgi:disulfide bond formation protein DsbB
MINRVPSPFTALVIMGLIAAMTLAGALVFEYGFKLKPCALCLQQRYPYYAALLLCFAGVLYPWGEAARQRFCLALAFVFAISVVLGVYHAGVEWGWFLGPRDCSGSDTAPLSTGDLLSALKNVQVANCAEAAWRFLGLSLAGWNALISFSLMTLAAFSWRYGSSSVSQ